MSDLLNESLNDSFSDPFNESAPNCLSEYLSDLLSEPLRDSLSDYVSYPRSDTLHHLLSLFTDFDLCGAAFRLRVPSNARKYTFPQGNISNKNYAKITAEGMNVTQ